MSQLLRFPDDERESVVDLYRRLRAGEARLIDAQRERHHEMRGHDPGMWYCCSQPDCVGLAVELEIAAPRRSKP